jgi:AbrB family looped-hinge helix DNA binding protein
MGEILPLDEKGRVLIPKPLREALDLHPGDKAIVELDEKGEYVRILPSRERKLLHLTIDLGDQPGALAKAAAALSSLGVDLVSTRSHSARRGQSAVWEVQCNPQGAAMGRIKAVLEKAGARLAASKWSD